MGLLVEIVLCALVVNLMCRHFRESFSTIYKRKNTDVSFIVIQLLSLIPFINIFVVLIFIICIISNSSKEVADLLFGKIGGEK